MVGFDVSDAFDESFFDTFSIIRRTEVVGNEGFPVVTPTVIANQYGVITMASPNDLERMPEADVSTKAIVVVTQSRLQLESNGIKADLVQCMNGEYFQVVTVEDYSRYGVGYIFAIAKAIDYQDKPPTPNPIG